MRVFDYSPTGCACAAGLASIGHDAHSIGELFTTFSCLFLLIQRLLWPFLIAGFVTIPYGRPAETIKVWLTWDAFGQRGAVVGSRKGCWAHVCDDWKWSGAVRNRQTGRNT